jgi:hypothetical protein
LLTPKFDGADVLAAVHFDLATQRLPVIATTSVDSPVQKNAMRPDVQAWVVKSAFD